MVTTTEKLRQLCIDNGYFDHGTNYQYNRLFEMNQSDWALNDIALVIWICSGPEQEYGDIVDVLIAAQQDYIRMMEGQE